MGEELYGEFFVDEAESVGHNSGCWATVEEQLNFFAILEQSLSTLPGET